MCIRDRGTASDEIYQPVSEIGKLFLPFLVKPREALPCEMQTDRHSGNRQRNADPYRIDVARQPIQCRDEHHKSASCDYSRSRDRNCEIPEVFVDADRGLI